MGFPMSLPFLSIAVTQIMDKGLRPRETIMAHHDYFVITYVTVAKAVLYAIWFFLFTWAINRDQKKSK